MSCSCACAVYCLFDAPGASRHPLPGVKPSRRKVAFSLDRTAQAVLSDICGISPVLSAVIFGGGGGSGACVFSATIPNFEFYYFLGG